MSTSPIASCAPRGYADAYAMAPDPNETPAARAPEAAPELDLAPPKRRLWPVLLGLSIAAGGGGLLALRSFREPDPLRVVVAVDLDGHFWQGSRASAALVNELCQRLDQSGFEPVRAGDPDILAVLKDAPSPEEAAKKLRASFVVTAKLAPQTIEHPTPGGYFESRVEGTIEVRRLGDDAGGTGKLVGWAGAKTKEESIRLLGETLGVQAFDQVLPHIVENPAIQNVFKGSDIKLADRVAKAKKYVDGRRDRLAEVQKNYEDLAKRRADYDKGPAKVTYHSAMSAQDSLGGISPAGFLVKTADVTPFVAPRTMNLTYITGLETLEWRTLGGERKVLWSGYHLFSYPSVATAGGPVVFVEDLFGWGKTITVVDPDGKSRRVRLDPEHRFLDPLVADSGKACAVYDRPCKTCLSADLLVVSLDDGKELFRRPNDNGTYFGFAWLGPQKLAFLYTPPPPNMDELKPDATEDQTVPRESIFVADLSANPPAVEKVYTAPSGISMEGIKASRDGKYLVMGYYENWSQIGVFDVEAKKMTTHDAGASMLNPSFSPDAKLVAFSSSNDIALYDLAAKKKLLLTKNPWRERYPVFSVDGERVYFESRASDPLYEQRDLSLIGSVAVRDARPVEESAQGDK